MFKLYNSLCLYIIYSHWRAAIVGPGRLTMQILDDVKAVMIVDLDYRIGNFTEKDFSRYFLDAG